MRPGEGAMITITIKTDNAAFGDLPLERCHEIARILHELSVEIAGGVMPTSLRDINGNRVGTVTDDEADS